PPASPLRPSQRSTALGPRASAGGWPQRPPSARRRRRVEPGEQLRPLRGDLRRGRLVPLAPPPQEPELEAPGDPLLPRLRRPPPAAGVVLRRSLLLLLVLAGNRGGVRLGLQPPRGRRPGVPDRPHQRPRRTRGRRPVRPPGQ